MEPNSKHSVIGSPTKLLWVAAVLLVARLIVMGGVAYGEEPVKSSIDWIDLGVPLASSATTLTEKESAPVPEPDVISKETAAEIERLAVESRHAGKVLLFQFDADGSDSCARMQKHTFTNREISSLLAERFLPIRVTDRSRSGVKDERLAVELRKKYRVFAYPTLIVADAQGEPLISLIGNCSSLTTYRFLTRALGTAERSTSVGNLTSSAPL